MSINGLKDSFQRSYMCGLNGYIIGDLPSEDGARGVIDGFEGMGDKILTPFQVLAKNILTV